jgi:hypothetical protein
MIVGSGRMINSNSKCDTSSKYVFPYFSQQLLRDKPHLIYELPESMANM